MVCLGLLFAIFATFFFSIIFFMCLEYRLEHHQFLAFCERRKQELLHPAGPSVPDSTSDSSPPVAFLRDYSITLV